MRTEASVEIDCPIEAVFELTNSHVTQWSSIVVHDEVLEEQPDGVGTTFLTVTQDRGQRMEFHGVVTQYEPPTLHSIQLTGKMFDIDVVYRFEAVTPERTRVTQISIVTPKGFLKLIFTLFGWMMVKANCDAALKELNQLKRYCEDGTVAK